MTQQWNNHRQPVIRRLTTALVVVMVALALLASINVAMDLWSQSERVDLDRKITEYMVFRDYIDAINAINEGLWLEVNGHASLGKSRGMVGVTQARRARGELSHAKTLPMSRIEPIFRMADTLVERREEVRQLVKLSAEDAGAGSREDQGVERSLGDRLELIAGLTDAIKIKDELARREIVVEIERTESRVKRAAQLIGLASGTMALALIVGVFMGGMRLTRSIVGMVEALRAQTLQLTELKEQAVSANRSKSEFLANMSHEIRTPMTAILGYTDLLADHRLPPADRVNHLKTIRRNGHHLLAIINDILDLSKIEAGKMEVERIRISLWQLVDEVTALMRVRAIEKGLSLSTEFAFPVPEAVLTDPVRLRQVLVNLIGNAIKFTEQGGVRLIVRVDSQATAPRIGFEVVDTGIGMTPQQLDKLFQPFVQADSSTTRRFGGTGLGLTVSKRFAEMLGGDIEVHSVLGSGCSFVVTIDPGHLDGVHMIRNAEEGGRSVDASDQTVPGKAALSGRVLLAEDGPDNQRLIRFILREAGLKVEVAENGRVAIDMAREARRTGEPFDLVLMDMQMPVLDGYAATRALRDDGFTCPIIALTAHAMSGDRDRCLAAGCNDYATKPIDKDEFLALLRHALQDVPAI